MKAFILFISLIQFSICFAQDELKKQLHFIVNDSELFFRGSKGEIDRIMGQDTFYKCNMRLSGANNCSISFRSGDFKWASYSCYLLESGSLKNAEDEALTWREIVRSVASTYSEEVKHGKSKNIYGNPEHQFLFKRVESNRESWIEIIYAKDRRNYYVYLSVGWQDLF